MDEGQRKFGFLFNLGDLLSHTIHLRRLCKPCSHMQKEKKKTLAHFVPTHSPRTPTQLYTSSTSIAAATVSSTAIVGGWRSRSKRHAISPLPLSAAYLHWHSRLWSTGVFCGIGPRIFLMEKVINLAKYSLISYRSPSVAVNQPAEIAVESFCSSWFVGVHSCVHSASTNRATVVVASQKRSSISPFRMTSRSARYVQSQPTTVGMA